MALSIFSNSSSFSAHINQVLTRAVNVQNQLCDNVINSHGVKLLHISSFELDLVINWLKLQNSNRVSGIGICSDRPNISEMLECVDLGCKAYCNSYMSMTSYQQMIRLLSNGQSWFPPPLLEETFRLAKIATRKKDPIQLQDELTPREKEIAFAVVEGMSNKEVALKYQISERTVKTHLTNIYIKLQIKDRVALVLRLT